MNEWFQSIGVEATAMTGWEAVAVVLAMAYLLLAMKRSLWCWPAAFVSTLIYTVLFWNVALLMESALNVFYMVMAIYGYWQWRYGDPDDLSGESHGAQIHTWTIKRHFQVMIATACVAALAGYLMSKYTHADMPYLDAATTCFAVVGTFMLAYKVLETWLYWVVIDLASIVLYVNKSFMLTSALFVGYVVLAAVSYFVWRRAMHEESHAHA
ncbi:nicotinamide riboside transporter PnuC [Echinimonas agarilytica]|uniref:Nicotinamide riboside transporter PnuC n=1 Tax=Echinimonas agarilytica TaxID=1215918 RepID=A0AA42B9B8_9GAMM|nr:nicotinamide riboside transporter PnuC [Echinimonas agarilytica]MCM2681382.1 nicotinamide riboside transporter PnuC [Echinimonas agarilytica]